MSDQPLNINVPTDTATTAIPLIADGTLAHVRLKNISQTERDGNPIVKWELTLVEPAPTTDGYEVQAGFPLFINFDPSKDFLVQKMARFVDGFLGTGDANNKKGKPPRPALNAETVSRMIGSEGWAKVTVQKSKSGYVGNDISSITYPADLAAAAA